MKKIKVILIITLHVLISNFSLGQESDETVIRRLENEEREAILKGDTMKLSQLMSFKIVVQNPENAIVGFEQIIDELKQERLITPPLKDLLKR